MRLHPTYGTNQYISKIINTALPKEEQILLKLNYRQLKELFNEQPQVSEVNRLLDAKNVITDKSLKIVADISSSSIQSGLQLALDSINFPLIGKGEQNQIQIKLALQNKVEDIDIIMIEEPENHLSHINLSKLVNYIEENRNDKQLFIATHSSYVLNKLSLKKLCLISEKYIRLKDIDDQVSKSLKRLPGYDTLRAVLSPKTILVEGPSDELVLKKIFFDKHGLLPEEKGIDIIVVRGIGFKNYLEIAKHIGSDLRVVKDNDGNYKENIEDYKKNYKSVNFFSPTDDALYSLEPALIASNSENGEKLDLYAKVVLSTKTFNKYKEGVGLEEKVDFLRDWYRGDSGTGKKKVDSAMRIFESQEKISYPD